MSQLYIYLPWFLTVSGLIVICKVETCNLLQCTRRCWSLLRCCVWQTPGPGHYGLPCPDMYKTRAPGYTIIGRKSLSTESVNTPGPAAHSPDMVHFSLCCWLTFIFSRIIDHISSSPQDTPVQEVFSWLLAGHQLTVSGGPSSISAI